MKLLFRVRISGLENLPRDNQGLLIITNHTSAIDGLFLYFFLPLQSVYTTNRELLPQWLIRLLMRFVEFIVFDNVGTAPLREAIRALKEGKNVSIFPESRPSTTTTMMKVYDSAGLIANKTKAKIVVVSLDGLQHSVFSSSKGLTKKRLFPQVSIHISVDIAESKEDVKKQRARKDTSSRIVRLMEDNRFHVACREETLFDAVIRAATTSGPGSYILEDSTGARLSYRQLITRCFVLGNYIAQKSAPSERIGVLLPSTVAGAATFFACQAYGRTPAMLNFTSGPQGLAASVETGDIKMVITSESFVAAGKLDQEIEALSDKVTVCYLENIRDAISVKAKIKGLFLGMAPKTAHRLLRGRTTPKSAAAILFTSGSEGTPKGVVLSHVNLLSNYAQVENIIDLTKKDRVLNALPIFHSFGLMGGLLVPLLKGTPSYQYPSPLHYRAIPELCYTLGVTCLFGTTTFLRGYGRSAHPYDFHKMRYVISGAEKMTKETRDLWAEKFGLRIFEGYGITEASPVIAVNNPMQCKFGTVGKLVTQIDYYISPIDGIKKGGQLVIKGPNVMLGYLFHGKNGEIVTPATESHGAGWHETGDVVEIDNEGFVTIVGRVKRFAKIAGEMISLGAIEDIARLTWPESTHAAVAFEDANKGEQILLITDRKNMSRAEFAQSAKDLGYSELFSPRVIQQIEEIPLLGSGKIDYSKIKKLFAPDTSEN